MFKVKLNIITSILLPYQPHSSRCYFCWTLCITHVRFYTHTHTSTHTKCLRCGVYFICKAHLNVDWPHFKCSTALQGQWPRYGPAPDSVRPIRPSWQWRRAGRGRAHEIRGYRYQHRAWCSVSAEQRLAGRDDWHLQKRGQGPQQTGITEITQLPALGNWVSSGSPAKRGNWGLPAGSPTVGTIQSRLSCAWSTWPSCSLNSERSHGTTR